MLDTIDRDFLDIDLNLADRSKFQKILHTPLSIAPVAGLIHLSLIRVSIATFARSILSTDCNLELGHYVRAAGVPEIITAIFLLFAASILPRLTSLEMGSIFAGSSKFPGQRAPTSSAFTSGDDDDNPTLRNLPASPPMSNISNLDQPSYKTPSTAVARSDSVVAGMELAKQKVTTWVGNMKELREYRGVAPMDLSLQLTKMNAAFRTHYNPGRSSEIDVAGIILTGWSQRTGSRFSMERWWKILRVRKQWWRLTPGTSSFSNRNSSIHYMTYTVYSSFFRDLVAASSAIEKQAPTTAASSRSVSLCTIKNECFSREAFTISNGYHSHLDRANIVGDLAIEAFRICLFRCYFAYSANVKATDPCPSSRCGYLCVLGSSQTSEKMSGVGHNLKPATNHNFIEPAKGNIDTPEQNINCNAIIIVHPTGKFHNRAYITEDVSIGVLTPRFVTINEILKAGVVVHLKSHDLRGARITPGYSSIRQDGEVVRISRRRSAHPEETSQLRDT
ncbi:hypothetical protein BU16DRAFT_532488 [Lophium mytilinum]|uniref:Uncharacterized protein n=1 Tax=Lophium mytilinum TaxID=390894 RepID=A0A6A6RBJ1_9PEZI|nr:hypothetical protein BU16DRAFT_532488 [Lophium mytilinum]